MVFTGFCAPSRQKTPVFTRFSALFQRLIPCYLSFTPLLSQVFFVPAFLSHHSLGPRQGARVDPPRNHAWCPSRADFCGWFLARLGKKKRRLVEGLDWKGVVSLGWARAQGAPNKTMLRGIKHFCENLLGKKRLPVDVCFLNPTIH